VGALAGDAGVIEPAPVELNDLRPVLDPQSGIVSRRQLTEHGADRSDLRRWLRTRQLVVVHKGVYVNHTGPLTWSSRAWAGVHRYWPAALGFESAVNRAGEVIHVVVDEGRSSTVAEHRVTVHRLRNFETRVRLDKSPPEQRFEDAVLSVCSTLTRIKALELLSEACRSRRTTPSRLHDELVGRGNLTDRAWLLEVLDDAACGVQSVLESAFLRRVERAHGLPSGERQHRERTAQGIVYRDVRYPRYAVLVELDGRLGHQAFAERGADLARDLEAAASGSQLTVRLGWQQCELEPCSTAMALGTVLQWRGWSGSPRPCRTTCPVARAA
jgi:hypothetical protein